MGPDRKYISLWCAASARRFRVKCKERNPLLVPKMHGCVSTNPTLFEENMYKELRSTEITHICTECGAECGADFEWDDGSGYFCDLCEAKDHYNYMGWMLGIWLNPD